MGTTEIKTGGIRSGDVKDFSLRCEDFRPAEDACGVPGPQGPAGAPGPAGTGAEGLTSTKVRVQEEVIEMTCSAPEDGPMGYASHCTGEEQVEARCEPGEVVTGGSVRRPSTENQSTATSYYSVSASASDDRPDPLAGTPTAWTADARASATSSSFTTDPPPTPPNPTVTVYAVCAS